jgi:hypothetical protein
LETKHSNKPLVFLKVFLIVFSYCQTYFYIHTKHNLSFVSTRLCTLYLVSGIFLEGGVGWEWVIIMLVLVSGIFLEGGVGVGVGYNHA